MDRKFKFITKTSWRGKTPYFYPPLYYLPKLEKQNFEEFKPLINISNNKLNLYMHFPLCAKVCPFCTYFTHSWLEWKKCCNDYFKPKSFKQDYNKFILKELELWLRLISEKIENPEICSIYMGGGTPSLWFWNATEIRDFIDNLSEIININKISEVTFEVHPCAYNFNTIDELKKMFNDKLRISVGVQSFQEDVLKIIRGLEFNQHKEKSKELIKRLIEESIRFNIDIMWGMKDFPISKELKNIEKELNLSGEKLYLQPETYTFYHIWAPNNLENIDLYENEMETDYNKILKQREEIFKTMKKWGYEPNLYIEYFIKKNIKNKINKNIYNINQMKATNYIGCGLNSHGYLGNIVYENFIDYKKYKNYLKKHSLPVKSFYIYNDKDFDKKKVILGLRIPKNKYKKNEINNIINNKDIIKDYFENAGKGKLKLKEKAKIKVPELMKFLMQERIFPEVQYVLEKVVCFIKNKTLTEKDIDYILKTLTFDIFHILNIATEYKVVVSNLAYFSSIKNKVFFGMPWGVDKKEWKQVYDKWEKIPAEYRISLYELFFKNKEYLGGSYPIKISKAEVNEIKNNLKKYYKLIRKKLALAKEIEGKLKKIESADNIGIKEFINILVTFLGDGEFIYFLGIKTGLKSEIGGVILSTTEELSENDLDKIYSVLSAIYMPLIEKEFFDSIKKHALRSAMSAIMARNMSHNIGSHVFSDLVATGLPMGDDMQRNFLRYNQHRMDFIAQITTEIPSWTYPAWFHKEIMREFYNQYLLIDRIGVSEGLRAYDWPDEPSEGDMRRKIIIRTASKIKGKGFKWIVNEYRKRKKDWFKALKDDFQIAVPAGIVGYHALYVIIEDFLRNEAKHNYLKRIKFEEDMKRILIIPGAKKGIDHIVSKGYPVDEGKDKPRIYVDIVPLSKISEIDGIKYNFCIVCDEKVENNDIIEKMPKDKKMSKDRIYKKSNLRESLKEKINALCAGNIPQDNNIKELIKELRKNDIFIIQNDSYQTFDTISCLVALDKLKEFPYYKAIIVDGINNNIEKLTKKIMEKQYPPERIFILTNNTKLPDKPDDDKLCPHYLTKKESDYIQSLLNKIKDCENNQENADFYIRELEKYLSDIPLRINIKIEEDQNDRDIYWITIWSDMPHRGKDTVKFRETPDSKEEEVRIYKMLNAYLKRSFINEDGSIRKENWGLQEMKICAGFLQQRSVLEIGAEGDSVINIEENDEKTGLPRGIIKCIPVDRKGREKKENAIKDESIYYTGFHFWVKKNKEVYVVKGDNNGRGQK